MWVHDLLKIKATTASSLVVLLFSCVYMYMYVPEFVLQLTDSDLMRIAVTYDVNELSLFVELCVGATASLVTSK